LFIFFERSHEDSDVYDSALVKKKTSPSLEEDVILRAEKILRH
jgi:hypothetical protein